MKQLYILISLVAFSYGQTATYTGLTGMIYSPNYPEDYENSANDSYIITVPAGRYIHLTFLDFLTEEPYDYLSVKTGSGNEMYTVANYSRISGDKTGFQIDINSSEATLVFTSDLTNTFRGFAIKFDAIETGTMYEPTNTCSSPIHIQRFGIVTSPNFPENYPNNAFCSYLLTAQAGNIIELEFVAFNTEAGYDVLYVYDGPNNASTMIGKFSGKQIPSIILSTGNSIYMFFSSDLVNNFSGFSAVYTQISANNKDRRGVLPQALGTDPTLRKDVNNFKWLNSRRGAGQTEKNSST
uniref:CUB domain-containing protein n=1 Tax=Caenorhabditis japonica TaxID=281687 RepID=A0A8R1DVH8_CAEJA